MGGPNCSPTPAAPWWAEKGHLPLWPLPPFAILLFSTKLTIRILEHKSWFRMAPPSVDIACLAKSQDPPLLPCQAEPQAYLP